MSTLKQHFKQNLTLFFFIAAFSAYSSAFAEMTETEKADAHHAQNSLDWPGIYHGFTPCTDCIGIKTMLALNTNNSYLLIIQYIGKSDREITEKGKFTWNNTSNTITLTPRNSSQTRQYLVADNTLTQLDNNGNHMGGDLAERYILRRNEISEPKKQASHH